MKKKLAGKKGKKAFFAVSTVLASYLVGDRFWDEDRKDENHDGLSIEREGHRSSEKTGCGRAEGDAAGSGGCR